MTSRNEKRINSHPPPTAFTEQDNNKTNSDPTASFSFATPTEFVELPSKGRFYPEGHPLHNAESVEIRFMTAKDEDILTSKSLLRKGIAIDRLLQNIINDKNVKIADLLVGDKNALVVAARVSGYGADYKTRVQCPACAKSVQFEFDLDEAELNHGEDFSDEYDAEERDGLFYVTLPKTKAEVGIRLLTSADEKAIVKSMEKRTKNNLPDSNVTDQCRYLIQSVNGDSDRQAVNTLIANMPALDSKYLREFYSKSAPNIDLSQTFDCENCGYEQEMEVPFTTDFFWPR